MTLRLTIENVASLTSGDPTAMVLDEHGLVIGRAAHADWTLPDTRNHISSLHAEIDYADGRYILTDRSTNGVFVNGGSRLTAPHVMRDGDLITIGQYEIRAAVTGGGSAVSNGSSGGASDPFGGGLDWGSGSAGGAKAADTNKFGREPPKPLFQSGGDPLMNAFAPPSGAFPPAPPPAASDPFGLSAPVAPTPFAGAPNPFGTGAPAPSPFGAPAAAPSPFGAIPAPDPFGVAAPAPQPSNPFAAPAPTGDPFGTAQPAAAANPFGAPSPSSAPAPAAPVAADPWAQLHKFDTLDFATAATPDVPAAVAVEPVAAAAPPPSPAPASPAADALFARFLAAAGLKPTDLGEATPVAVIESAARLLRQTADGLIRLLDARARIRHQFGVGAQVTTFQRAGNNPLKWTRSPEQALKQLVGSPDPGFLPGPLAVQGAFEDLQAHEVAMIAAMQEALGATVERFSPDAIKARVTAKGGLLPGSREAALWRAFEGEYKALAHESEAAYLDLFAKNFRKAYERNIKKADNP
ncbi:type VI secretion system-associated FHA domain protein TagH [Glacieibacterium megasporae]|uniref:type VI secretion system-associated FHA domain protein TagH n=1 Tax=Glacieibacterium megasporae TaxID=2835787 RepID=UPI001C1E4838|nr:type VI secretion system-associated FHA domain protein TagH [Polymorphobacter megasporae]UAJ09823.1 type VI secretion system-associated FHA domain protein TagH [Polymorphobacter megasporae]